jgi:hypothetical protein
MQTSIPILAVPRVTPGTLWATIVGLIAVALVLSSVASTRAQAEDAKMAGGPVVTTEEVEPGVERVLGDDAGHDLAQEVPRHGRDMHRIAIGPDGTIWLAGSYDRSDDEHAQGQQVWAIGKPGLWGFEDGVPEYIESLFVGEDGRLWAIGSGVAAFDGETWTSLSGASRRLGTDDGTLWFVHPQGGVEAWVGTDSKRYLKRHEIREIALASDGTVWAVGHARNGGGAVYRITREGAAE